MNTFYFDKMHMLYNQNKSCVKSCQKHCFLRKQTLFSSQKTIVAQKTPLFSNMCTFYPIVLKRQNITAAFYIDVFALEVGCDGSSLI